MCTLLWWRLSQSAWATGNQSIWGKYLSYGSLNVSLYVAIFERDATLTLISASILEAITTLFVKCTSLMTTELHWGRVPFNCHHTWDLFGTFEASIIWMPPKCHPVFIFIFIPTTATTAGASVCGRTSPSFFVWCVTIMTSRFVWFCIVRSTCVLMSSHRDRLWMVWFCHLRCNCIVIGFHRDRLWVTDLQARTCWNSFLFEILPAAGILFCILPATGVE